MLGCHSKKTRVGRRRKYQNRPYPASAGGSRRPRSMLQRVECRAGVCAQGDAGEAMKNPSESNPARGKSVSPRSLASRHPCAFTSASSIPNGEAKRRGSVTTGLNSLSTWGANTRGCGCLAKASSNHPRAASCRGTSRTSTWTRNLVPIPWIMSFPRGPLKVHHGPTRVCGLYPPRKAADP